MVFKFRKKISSFSSFWGSSCRWCRIGLVGCVGLIAACAANGPTDLKIDSDLNSTSTTPDLKLRSGEIITVPAERYIVEHATAMFSFSREQEEFSLALSGQRIARELGISSFITRDNVLVLDINKCIKSGKIYPCSYKEIKWQR